MHEVISDGVLRGHCDTQTHAEQRARYAFGRYSAMLMQVAGSCLVSLGTRNGFTYQYNERKG